MARVSRIGLILGVISLWGASAAVPANGQDSGGKAEAVSLARNVGATDIQVPSAAINNDYRIGVDDVLEVHVWKETELSRVIPVRPDGKISLPLVGELGAEGRTALELGEVITARLSNYLTRPEVTVIVQKINSQRYYIIGEVNGSGVYPLTLPVTVVQALAMAGGFREFARTDEILVIRRVKDSTVRIAFSYKDWIKKKKKHDYMQLQNGDVIVVR